MEAAGGVDDDDVGAAGAGGGDRVEDDGAGIGAFLAANQFGAGAPRPLGQLLGGGGANVSPAARMHREAHLST